MAPKETPKPVMVICFAQQEDGQPQHWNNFMTGDIVKEGEWKPSTQVPATGLLMDLHTNDLQNLLCRAGFRAMPSKSNKNAMVVELVKNWHLVCNGAGSSGGGSGAGSSGGGSYDKLTKVQLLHECSKRGIMEDTQGRKITIKTSNALMISALEDDDKGSGEDDEDLNYDYVVMRQGVQIYRGSTYWPDEGEGVSNDMMNADGSWDHKWMDPYRKSSLMAWYFNAFRSDTGQRLQNDATDGKLPAGTVIEFRMDEESNDDDEGDEEQHELKARFKEGYDDEGDEEEEDEEDGSNQDEEDGSNQHEEDGSNHDEEDGEKDA